MLPTLWWEDVIPEARGRAPAARRLSVEWLEDRTVPGFLGPVNYAVGDSPGAVAVADVNGDGRADIVTATSDKSSVSVLLGNGDGSFQAAHSFRTGAGTFSVVTGDLNSDGKMDVVTANLNDVSVLLAKANGSLQAAKLVDVGGNPLSVAVGDFDADGKLDLAVTSQIQSFAINYDSDYTGFWSSVQRTWSTTGQRSVLLGHGDGTFASSVSSVTGESVHSEFESYYVQYPYYHYSSSDSHWGDSAPTWAAMGDFNGDGKLDGVLGSRSATDLVVLPGDGRGGFTAGTSLAMASRPPATAASELNGDGKLDLVTVAGNNAIVFLGNGDCTFRPRSTYAAGADLQFAAVADLNGDHIRDVVVAQAGGKSVNVLLGNGDGSFTLPLAWPAAGPAVLAVGHLNADGLPDVVTANSQFNSAAVLINDGAWPALPPAVAAIRINNGSAQRSMVTSLTVTFSGQVTLDPGAFVVMPFAGGPAVTLTATTAVVGGATMATLTFPGTIGGSLPDGDWVLRTVASKVRDLAGVLMAADRTDRFFRLYGDVNGDRAVNGADLASFRSAFGTSLGDPGYLAALDFDGDGVINGTDLVQFRARFGVILP